MRYPRRPRACRGRQGWRTGLIILDSREKAHFLREKADAIELLKYGKGTGGQQYSFDILIKRDAPPTEIRLERKRFGDYVQSWLSGKLERQLEPVDALIVEMPGSMEKLLWTDEEKEMNERGYKHLAKIALSMPVIYSTGEEHTWRILKYLEGTPTLEIRAKKNVAKADGFWMSMFKALGVNPHRVRKDGQGTVGEALRKAVNDEAFLTSLGIDSWKGLGLTSRAQEQARQAILADATSDDTGRL